MEKARAIGLRVSWALIFLMMLFAGRVLAQLIQSLTDLPFLPSFDVWHSATLHYPVLVAFQLVILITMGAVIWKTRKGTLGAGPWRHKLCFMFGGTYLAAMIFRLVAGLTFLSNVTWFTAHLPTVFHFVLASFVLVVGVYLHRIQKL